jgi:hypothetical protein
MIHSRPDVASKVQDAVYRTAWLVRNLHSLGFGPETTAMLMGLEAVAQDLSARAPWALPNKPNEPKPDCSSRRKCIEALMNAGCVDAAVALLSDLARVEDDIVGDLRRNDKIMAAHKEKTREYTRVKFTLPDLASAKDSSSALSAFKATVCSRLCELGRHGLYQAGAMVLRDVLTVDNDCSELQPYQIAVFQNIAFYLKRWPKDQSVLLQALFHSIDRAALFRNPKARFLLLDVAGLRAAEYRDAYGKITKLGDDFEKIDNITMKYSSRGMRDWRRNSSSISISKGNWRSWRDRHMRRYPRMASSCFSSWQTLHASSGGKKWRLPCWNFLRRGQSFLRHRERRLKLCEIESR